MHSKPQLSSNINPGFFLYIPCFRMDEIIHHFHLAAVADWSFSSFTIHSMQDDCCLYLKHRLYLPENHFNITSSTDFTYLKFTSKSYIKHGLNLTLLTSKSLQHNFKYWLYLPQIYSKVSSNTCDSIIFQIQSNVTSNTNSTCIKFT